MRIIFMERPLLNYSSLQQGVTLVELMIVLVLVGILALWVVPRLEINQLNGQGETQQILMTLRYAHQTALTSGCAINVILTPNTVSLNYGNSVCGNHVPLKLPHSDQAFLLTTQTPINGLSWTYSATGQPSLSQDIQVGEHTFHVEAETGFVYLTN